MRRHRLPVRLRLVVGFAGAMLILLAAAGAFVFWRVQVALDRRLNEDLASQTSDVREAGRHLPARAALSSLREQARDAQLLDADGGVLASGSAIAGGRALITPEEARRATRSALETGQGNLFSKRGKHLRILALPIEGNRRAAVAVSAVRLDQRDEALRELLAQLGLANLVALAGASLVGYRFAHVALDPVERYRAQAERVAAGASGVRLDVPEGPPDEITRLGAMLNAMLDALERAAARQQEFIDDASHELRTPLSTLTAEIDVALRKPRTRDEYETTLRRLADDTASIRDLAETLLTLGALGSTTPDAANVRVEPLLSSAARRAEAQLADRRDRTVVVRAADGLGVYGDASLLERALGNLADNAVRHGSGAITLSADATPDAALTIIAVHDEGEIKPAFLPSAAARFRQDELSRSGEGAGLGLSLVDAIATAHRGQLRICSAGHHHATTHGELDELACRHPERGTTISLLVPAARATAPTGQDRAVRKWRLRRE